MSPDTLPDSYALAVKAKQSVTAYDSEHPERPFFLRARWAGAEADPFGHGERGASAP